MSAENAKMIGIENHVGTVKVAGSVIVQDPSQRPTGSNEFSLPRLETYRGLDKELQYLDLLFFHKRPKKVDICDLLGMRKSGLAKQFSICKKCGEIDCVFWFKAQNKNDIEKSRKQLKDLYQNLKNIFDNTSQTNDLKDHVKSLEFNHLTSHFVIQVFRIILIGFNIYTKLAEMVTCIPLELQVAAAYVRQKKKCTVQYFGNQHSYINITIPECVFNPYTKLLYFGEIKILKFCTIFDSERRAFDDLL